MMSKEELKALIPHGERQKVATKAGVSTQAVSNFFRGRSNSHKIEKAAIEVATTIQTAKAELIKGLKKAL